MIVFVGDSGLIERGADLAVRGCLHPRVLDAAPCEALAFTYVGIRRHDQQYGLLVQNGVDVRYGVLVEYARNVAKAPADWQCETLRKRWPPSQ